MLTLGLFAVVDEPRGSRRRRPDDERHAARPGAAGRDRLERSALAARRGASRGSLPSLDHYQVLEVPRAATRGQIVAAADEKKQHYDPATYPPIVRDAMMAINRRIDEAAESLENPVRRQAYDKLLHSAPGARRRRSAAARDAAHRSPIRTSSRASELSAPAITTARSCC